MSICRQYTLVKSLDAEIVARCLKCRSWGCDLCQPDRQRQLMAQAAQGAPERFITLTIDPQAAPDAEGRLRLLSHAWKVIVKRLRREHPNSPVEYLAVVESTKQGEPHLHILARCPYVPQATLSQWMLDLANSPIVDIRRVHGAREAARYVAKYVGKAPAQFGAAKRYWQSRHYQLPDEERIKELANQNAPWTLIPYNLATVARLLTLNGFALRTESDGKLVGHLRADYPPLGWPEGGWYDPLYSS